MTADSKQDRDDSRDDELLAELLPQLDSDVAPVDAEFLAGLRIRSSAAFAEASVTRPADTKDVSPDSVRISSSRDRTMLTITARLALSITVAALGGLAWLTAWIGSGEAVGAVTLGDVLEQAIAAETLQLKVVRDGAEASVWVKQAADQPKRIRWEDSPTLYQIASGSRLWEIDEKDNRVQSGSTAWIKNQDSGDEIDLLAMLGVNEPADRFRRVRSVGRVRHAERDCRVFRFTTKQNLQPVRVECFADAETNELLTIAAWPNDLTKQDGPPVAELRLIARNIPVDESKFVVAESLSDDGRIGRVSDSQGIVTLRPVMRSRWTPVARQMLIKPGDWLRTDVRGANAIKVRLTSRVELTIGPGTQMELLSPFSAKIHGGEVQVSVPAKLEKDSFQLIGADGDTKKLKPAGGEPGKTFLRVLRDQKLHAQKDTPIWLKGFEGTSNNESIGSLIANIDGRNVPLSVGYHRVKVEIRDQIARTTIEESFVNRTPRRLEGVFHFPLPQDASISGFGMWIGGELVEADVVEKQRAREIYETILRERRDPGLLEWAGGNIFKARVFPIEGRSEKRIKIVYTQVLPLRANQYRYSYGLKSELLQKTPLRELSIDLFVNSELPLRSVKCPTHPARADLTEHSAHVELAAQEYSPTRDFEVVCEVDAQQSDVVVVPHQRGEDGYFLSQITLPGADGNWQREVLPDGDPLDVLLVCDTSASMDSDSRKTQSEFVASLLSSLGPKDRFNVAVCDVDCTWLFDESVSAGASGVDQIAQARNWLSDRTSLGWTDLDKTIASIQDRAGPSSHVIYIGDGIVTSGDASPQAFAARLDELFSDSESGDGRPTFHAVSVSSSFESVVLKSIAGIGGGSVRAIGGERTSQSVAFELLNEIAQPGLTDVKLEFRGVQVAAVYPERLPNLSAGTQQIIVGRYLPQGEDQSGEIIVTGKRGNEDVRYAARIHLKDAESGNSFIPRLWARAHLDQLLQQGSSQFIKDEIISLSEEFHIMTPYTSLLVLETDRDRERFGVKRRYQMRDGERFFADGRDNANYELLQQQMKRAGDWRIGLRRYILSELAGLGRSTAQFQQIKQMIDAVPQNGPMLNDLEFSTITISGAVSGTSRSSRQYYTYAGGVVSGGLGGGGGGVVLGRASGALGLAQAAQQIAGERLNRLSRDLNPLSERDGSGPLGGEFEGEEADVADKQLMANLRSDWDGDWLSKGKLEKAAELNFRQQAFGDSFAPMSSLMDGRVAAKRQRLLMPSAPMSGPAPASEAFSRRPWNLQKNLSAMDAIGYGWGGGYSNQAQYVSWVNQLFPRLSGPTVSPPNVPESEWSPEVIALSESLLQREALANLKGGLEIQQHSESVDVRWGDRKVSDTGSLALYSVDSWLRRPEPDSTQSLLNWCDGKQRGVFSLALLLGRVRKSDPADLKSVPPGGAPYSQVSLHESLRGYDATVSEEGPEATLLLTNRNQKSSQIRYTIDTNRNVILSIEHLQDGETTSRTTYSQYEEVAGLWWPLRTEGFDAKGRRTSVSTCQVSLLKDAEFAKRFTDELAVRADVQFLDGPLPSIRDAEVAVDDGSAGFEERLVLLLRSSLIQKWDEVLEQLDALEKTAPGKWGLPWIRAAVLNVARRHEELRQLLILLSEKLVEGRTNDFYLAEYVLNTAQSVGATDEQLRLLKMLKPVFDRQPEHVLGPRNWEMRRIPMLRNLGRMNEVLPLRKKLAVDFPWDINAQTQYARDLATDGDYDGAYAWLRQVLDSDAEWSQQERNQIRHGYAGLLRQQGDETGLVEFFEEWIEEDSSDESVNSQYLGAYVMAEREKEADVIAMRWLTEGRVERELTRSERARFNTAVSYALGRRYNQYMNYVPLEWLNPLADTALFFLRHEHHFDVAVKIIDWYQFKQTDASDRLYAEAAKILQAEAAELPMNELSAMVRWSLERSKLTTEDWSEIADTIQTRWDAVEEIKDRQPLGETLLSIYRSKFRESKQLPFMRQRIERVAGELEKIDPATLGVTAEQVRNDILKSHLATFRLGLFDELLSRKWSDEFEAEAFSLLEQVSAAASSTMRVTAHVEALHRFVDAMRKNRFQASMTTFQDEEHPEELTRHELAAKQYEFTKAAAEGVAERLASGVEGSGETFADWLRIERMFLDVSLGQNLEQVAEECWKILGDAPPAPLTDEQIEELDGEGFRRMALEEQLRARALVTISNLAVRRSAPKGLAERVLRYIDAGIKQQMTIAVEQGGDEGLSWKQAKYSMLVALDQPDNLEQELRKWIGSDEYIVPWQLALGRLLAERARIDEAIGLFETVERESQLSPADYRMLAGWYLVADRREDYVNAKVETFATTQEYQISNWIRQQLYPWQRSDRELPSEFDEQILLAFKALFKKSQHPQNYVWQLREFYQACRDFRLLQMIPDTVIGRTPQYVYPLLQSLNTTILPELRDEATADEIVARIRELREKAESASDRRALDLLEALIERKSSDVLNQPGPHADLAVAALKRAFEHDWAEGEYRQMADFLQKLGNIRETKLAQEQMRQLEGLHNRVEPGTDDRLFIAFYLARGHFYGYGRRDEGIAVMENAVREYRQAHPEGWPGQANTPLDGYLDFLEGVKRFAQAEKFLDDFIKSPANEGQRLWMLRRQNDVLIEALRHQGRVSLGENETLYRKLIDRLVEQAKTEDDNNQYAVLVQINKLFTTANNRHLNNVAGDVRTFAFKTLPPLLAGQTTQYQNVVNQVSRQVRDIAGARYGVEFLIERLENWPARYRNTWQDGWSRCGHNLAWWFQGTNRSLPTDLEARLLKIVLDELRKELRTRQHRYSYFFHRRRNYFWSEKAADFAKVAEEVLAESSDSARSVNHISQYLWDGLDLHTRAIEIRLIAHGKKLLDAGSLYALTGWLHEKKRWAEPIPIMEPVVRDFPDNIDYRMALLVSYARSSRPTQRDAMLAQTDDHFRAGGRWTEYNLKRLAETCVRIQLNQKAVDYYGELIPLAQRSRPNRGIGEGTVSNFYRQLSMAHARLGNTREAVDAASGAIIAWGPRHEQRSSALSQMKSALRQARDLNGYVEFLDDQLASTGQDSPLIRRMIGEVYAEKGQHEAAIAQLKLAEELQPFDRDTHAALVKSYDALEDQKAAAAQILKQLDFDRHNLELYKDLAKRLRDDEGQSERAVTTLVEAAPLEAEHHQALATIRQQQDRWSDAIDHWEHVASLRALEPNGLLKLAEAQLHEERWADARSTIARLRSKSWPSRFSNVKNQILQLERRIKE